RYYFFIVYNLNAEERASDLAEVSRALSENKLKHQIAARLHLSEAAQAHRLVETGQAIGNVVLDIP
ncbi:MAG TPA: zinc-binding dehydrogenase, partial [Burkholderiaceae bacterium]|nr:zinc-binding dehydrogenase [Burkholderiaceae bacterium]